MVKYTQTIRRLLPTNCLSVFDHYVELAVKGLNMVFTIFMVFCLLKPALATLMCLNNPMFQVSCPSCQYLISRIYIIQIPRRRQELHTKSIQLAPMLRRFQHNLNKAASVLFHRTFY